MRCPVPRTGTPLRPPWHTSATLFVLGPDPLPCDVDRTLCRSQPGYIWLGRPGGEGVLGRTCEIGGAIVQSLQGKHPGGQVEDQRRSKVRILVSIRGRAGPRRPAPARFALSAGGRGPSSPAQPPTDTGDRPSAGGLGQTPRYPPERTRERRKRRHRKGSLSPSHGGISRPGTARRYAARSVPRHAGGRLPRLPFTKHRELAAQNLSHHPVVGRDQLGLGVVADRPFGHVKLRLVERHEGQPLSAIRSSHGSSELRQAATASRWVASAPETAPSPPPGSRPSRHCAATQTVPFARASATHSRLCRWRRTYRSHRDRVEHQTYGAIPLTSICEVGERARCVFAPHH